tara:strand:- start:6829 stop:6987 length:159 start_codon:yes stop_codon:yes gene_type:complete
MSEKKVYSSLSNSFVTVSELQDQAEKNGFFIDDLGDGEYMFTPKKQKEVACN